MHEHFFEIKSFKIKGLTPDSNEPMRHFLSFKINTLECWPSGQWQN